VKTTKCALTASMLLLAASSCFLSGCSSKEDTLIVTINDKNLYMEDFLYDIYTIETENNHLDDYYQNKLGYSYWDYEYEGNTIRETAKSSVLAQVVMQEILADQAQQSGMSLSKNELAENKEDIDQLYATASEEAFSSLGMTREVLEKTLKREALSKKYYRELEDRFQIDETAIRRTIHKENYREYKTECLFAATISMEDNTMLQLSPQEKATAYQEITKALKNVAEETEFDTILNNNNRLAYSSRNFIHGSSIYEDAYQKAAISLKSGDYSDIVTTEYGYYIIHMLDNYSTDKYEQAVQDAISTKEEEQFAIIYNEIKKPYDITVSFTYWDTVTLGSITKFK